MPSPRPLPTRLKVLRGTDQPCRTNKNEPMPAADDVSPPPGISAAAMEHWPAMRNMLVDAGIATNVDTYALEIMCQSYATWRHALAELDDGELLVKTPNGFPVQSPYLAIANKAWGQFQKMLVEFGMTPSSRTKVSVPTTEENPFDAV